MLPASRCLSTMGKAMSAFKPTSKCDAGLQHPLMGARLGHLLRLLRCYGPPSPANWPLVAACIGSALCRMPFRLLDQVARHRRRDLLSDMSDPVFIIGHWRSGTTHLHNLLSLSPVFGHISPLASGLPDEILTLGTWLRPLLEKALPEDRHVDRVRVTPDSPQEDEIPLANMQMHSIFHALYFPKQFVALAQSGIFFEDVPARDIARWQAEARRFAEKIVIHQRKSLLLIKNIVYTARIRLLLDIWPMARFIFIRRNPYEVFASTRHYYQNLLHQLALQPFGHVELEPFIFATFLKLHEVYERDKGLIREGRLIEMSYEDLVTHPLSCLAKIHDVFDLPHWGEAERAMRVYLQQHADYQRNRLELSDTDREAIQQNWGAIMTSWGYEIRRYPGLSLPLQR
jgi:omega-hydroxy-beta-dihydromenaquinone-9 sulfotransferase